MKIENDVEHAIRQAFGAVVAGEPDRLDKAVESITTRGEDFTRTSISLALTIDFTALYAMYEGKRPSNEALEEVADSLADDAANTWAGDVTEDDSLEFLTALVDKRESTLDAAKFVLLAFGAGGWLLAASAPANGKWTDALDLILEQLEAAG